MDGLQQHIKFHNLGDLKYGLQEQWDCLPQHPIYDSDGASKCKVCTYVAGFHSFV